MPNDRGFYGDGGRYIREDDDRRYGGRRGSSFEDDDYSRRYTDGASNRNTWTEGARSAQGRSNYTYSGRDYEDTGEYRGGMAGEENRYGEPRWGRENSNRFGDGRYQETRRYGGRAGEESNGDGRYNRNDMDRYRNRGYGDYRQFASDEDREYNDMNRDRHDHDGRGFGAGVKRAVKGAVRGIRNVFDDDDDRRYYSSERQGYERDWDNENRRRNFDREDDYRYGRYRDYNRY